MRSLGCVLAVVVVLLHRPAPARADGAAATSPALVIDVIEAEAIGVRVYAATVTNYKKGGHQCSEGVSLGEAVVSPGKPLMIKAATPWLCVVQTYAPWTTVGWSSPVFVFHGLGDPPTHLALHTRDPSIASSGSAPPPAPVSYPATSGVAPFVAQVRGDRIGVRVAAGTTTPCTSGDNVQLFAGVLEPDKPLSLPTHAGCLCVQQTYAPFVTTGWNEGAITCRAQRCVGKSCKTDLMRPFSVTLWSKAP